MNFFTEIMREKYRKRITTISKADFFDLAADEVIKMSTVNGNEARSETLELALAAFTVGLALRIFPEPENDDKEGSEYE